MLIWAVIGVLVLFALLGPAALPAAAAGGLFGLVAVLLLSELNRRLQ